MNYEIDNRFSNLDNPEDDQSVDSDIDIPETSPDAELSPNSYIQSYPVQGAAFYPAPGTTLPLTPGTTFSPVPGAQTYYMPQPGWTDISFATPYNYELTSEEIITYIASCIKFEYDTDVTECQSVDDALADYMPHLEAGQWAAGLGAAVTMYPLLINASTGYGKTTFAVKTLANLARQQNQFVLLVVNRLILKNQVTKSLYESLLGYSLTIPDNNHDLIRAGRVIIATYQQLSGRFVDVLNKITKWANGRVGYIVMDEAHYFVADATMGGDTANIFHNLLLLSYMNLLQHQEIISSTITFSPCQRIYMTATPEYVKDIIALEECLIANYYKNIFCSMGDETGIRLLPKAIKEIQFPRKPPNVNLKFFHDWDEIVDKVSSQEDDEKWLIFVSDIKDGDDLKSKFGKTAIFINSKNNNQDEREKIERNGRFDAKVLIATSVLDNGVSLSDDKLKNIVIDSTEKAELIQMLGRKRFKPDEQANLFIKNKEYNEIKGYEDSAYRTLKNIQYQKDFPIDFEDLITQNNFAGASFFKYDPIKRIHRPCVYAEYYLCRRVEELKELRYDLNNDNDAFAKLVCEWLGINFSRHMLENQSSLVLIWGKIEAILLQIVRDYLADKDCKPKDSDSLSLKELIRYVDQKEIISKDTLKEKVDEMIGAIKSKKQGSGINIDKNSPTKTANNIFKYFGEKGFDLYEFSGRKNYMLSLKKEGSLESPPTN